MTDTELAIALRRMKPQFEKPGQEVISEAVTVIETQDKTISALQAENAALKEAQRWVPVGERLPDRITNKVIVLCKNGYVGFGHYEKFQGTETWYNLENHKPFTDWDLEDCETYEVTHWQPLPAAPKGE